MDLKPNWNVITDLSLKAAEDAKDAIGRTALLAETAMDATLISMVAFAILKGEHDGIREVMGESPLIRGAGELADAVAAELKNRKRSELKKVMPLIRELLKRKQA